MSIIHGGDFSEEMPPIVEVPRHRDVLPDGRDTIIIGEPARYAEFNHQQGDNPYGFRGVCGVVSVQDVMLQYGYDVSETDVLTYAIIHGHCAISDNPDDSGGTTIESQAELLNELGIPAHYEMGKSLEDVTAMIDQDRAVIMEVNAGILWQDARYVRDGGANHAVTVTGVARDPISDEIQGLYINDSGNGESAQFVPYEVLEQCFVDAGGMIVVTDLSHQR